MPASPPTSPTDALAQLVRQKRRLLEQLVMLGRRQGELVEAGDTATLLQVLGGKQQLIAGLSVVERGLDAFRQEDPDRRAWPSGASRAACKADADACNALLAEALATEERHERRLTERRDDVARRLQQAQCAHVAQAAYKPHLGGARRSPVLAADAATPISTTLDLTSET